MVTGPVKSERLAYSQAKTSIQHTLATSERSA
jgi:hypothetical protein